MIRTILGDDAFRAGMDLYFERHDGQAVTIEDFVQVFEDVSSRDLSQFALWYHQAGTPNVTVATSHEAAAGKLVLEIEQSVPPTPSESRKRLMHIPLAFGLVGPDGKDLAHASVDGAQVENGVIHLRKRRHVVTFTGLPERPALSLNRGFSAPITLSVEQRPQDQYFLARHDSDPFSRWQAFNGLLTEALIAACRKLSDGRAAEFPIELPTLAGAIAGDETLEPAYRALALVLPGEADIAREIGGNINPVAIHEAREGLIRKIAQANRLAFERQYRDLDISAEFSPDAQSAGRRALRNGLLDYLSALEGGAALAADHFRRADNMTDRAAALSVLAQRHAGTTEATDALSTFERSYRASPLVMDKWFLIQASAPGEGTLARVRGLMNHPAFSIKNPNRVRSLLGTFFSANQTGFHRVDGAGYALFRDVILDVDQHNPQLASRLATGLRSWRSLEPLRQDKAREALVAIAGSKQLSADVRDIVERTLG